MATETNSEDIIVAEVHKDNNGDDQGDKQFGFDKWAKELGLKRKTTGILVKEDLNDISSLSLVTLTELRGLGISLGQAKVICDYFDKAKPASNQIDTGTGDQLPDRNNTVPNITPDASQNMTLPNIREQANLLSDAGNTFNAILDGVVNSEHISSMDTVTAINPEQQLNPLGLGMVNSNKSLSAMDPLTTLTLSSTNKKVYHITKYLTEEVRTRRKNRRRDLVLSRTGDTDDQLVVRSEESHPYAGIAVEEWGAANCRLMFAMLSEGALKQQDVPYYLAYTATIFDFISRYDWNSILDYDHQYRERQAQHGFAWGSLNPCLELQLLQRRHTHYAHQHKFASGHHPQRGGQRTSFTSSEPCKQWLARGECRFGHRCKFQHVQIPQSSNTQTLPVYPSLNSQSKNFNANPRM